MRKRRTNKKSDAPTREKDAPARGRYAPAGGSDASVRGRDAPRNKAPHPHAIGNNAIHSTNSKA
ncbi:hypothetical protein [Oceanobacillus picturae]|uniref:hypothetical protein n=1 Tax=Oceanobacillus picturae TaxID=171693 RepID=UPI000568DB9E|nr:hypothetical protein [Oceanobacillus picturae]